MLRLEEEERQSLLFLQAEQAERQMELDRKQYKCDICQDGDVRLEDMITLSCEPRGHMFCVTCFAGYCSSKINDAAVGSSELVCPAFGCKTPITIHELKSHVSSELFDKFERFTMKSYCENESNNCRYCPKCSEWFAEIPQEPEDEHVWKAVVCEFVNYQHANIDFVVYVARHHTRVRKIKILLVQNLLHGNRRIQREMLILKLT